MKINQKFLCENFEIGRWTTVIYDNKKSNSIKPIHPNEWFTGECEFYRRSKRKKIVLVRLAECI